MNRSNIIVAIILLAVLSVLLRPNIVPNFTANFLPGFYEGTPCEWLRTGDDRAAHQSILGRTAGSDGLSIELDATGLPSDGSGVVLARIVMINNTVGTLAVVYNPTQVIVGDNGTSGLGLIFNPPLNIPLGTGRVSGGTIPEADIRVLGPGQRCVHTVEIPAGNLLSSPAFQNGQGLLSAFYRNNTPGVVSPQPGPTPIYTDQGLWTGFVSSAPVQLSAPPTQ